MLSFRNQAGATVGSVDSNIVTQRSWGYMSIVKKPKGHKDELLLEEICFQ